MSVTEAPALGTLTLTTSASLTFAGDTYCAECMSLAETAT